MRLSSQGGKETLQTAFSSSKWAKAIKQILIMRDIFDFEKFLA